MHGAIPPLPLSSWRGAYVIVGGRSLLLLLDKYLFRFCVRGSFVMRYGISSLSTSSVLPYPCCELESILNHPVFNLKFRMISLLYI
jgi:hypothetical protein